MGALRTTLLILPAVAMVHPAAFNNPADQFKMDEFEALQRFIGVDDLMAAESRHEQKESDKYCLTPGCVTAAAEVINTINDKADPCEDFYEFACGNFMQETVIPDHKTSEGSFSIVRDKLNERLRKLFESSAGTDEPDSYQSVRDFYASCMDEEYIEDHGKEELSKIVKELGGWPVLMGEKFNEDKFVWQKLSEKANRLGLSTGKIVSVSISTNYDDSTKRIMEIDQASLGLEREYLIKGFEDKDVQAYYRYMVDTAVYLGANRETAETELKESLLFELKLAEMTSPREERRNKTRLNNPMTITQASALYPDYDWVDHINNILDNQEVTVEASEIINVAEPGYFKAVGEYLPTVSKRVLANHMMWRFIKSTVSYLDKEALNIQLEYSKVLTGKEQQAPRWETCVKSVSGTDGTYLYFYEGSLTNAVGSMYAKTYFPASKKAVADEMVSNIRQEFKLMLDELDWMDSKTKERAHDKVDMMTPHIAYSKEILDNNLINEFYAGLKMDSPSYLKNILTLKKFISEYYVKEFRQPIDKQSWKTHGGAAIVNAFYSSSENSIQFPAGILDGVFFQSDRPSYMNYGAIGMVVGHEITHGFDDQGSQKDGEGNLVDWWEEETKAKYLEKAKCIIDQYGNFSVEVEDETINLNGINTQGENIADNGGYKEALRAYDRLAERYGQEPLLPGLPYTQRQLFWLSGASVWCVAMRPATLKNRVLTDPHSPGRFRVNGPYSNLKEFSDDWNCPVGSPMNPDKKCSVW